jgi:hypothetical protein
VAGARRRLAKNLKLPTFAHRFDDSCAARWSDNTAVAAAIRAGLASAGLGRTNRVQISRWRNGITVPNLAVQNAVDAWLREQPSPGLREQSASGLRERLTPGRASSAGPERGAKAAPQQRSVFRRSIPRSKGGDLV